MNIFKYIIVLLLQYPLFTFSQTKKINDSLENVLNNSLDDKLKLKIAGDLCWNYSTQNFNKALYFGKTELALAQKLNDSTAIALAYSDLGITYTRVNNLKEALNYHIKAFKLREQLGLKIKAAGSTSNIAVIYKQLGNYNDALEYMYKALKIYETVGDEPKQALVLGNMGNVYNEYKKFDAAKENFDKAIFLAKKHNAVTTLANSYSGLLNYYFQTKNYNQALKYALLAESYIKPLNTQSDLAVLYNSIGQIFYEQNKYDKAMPFYNKSLKIRLEMADNLGIASCYKNIASCYLKNKEYDLSINYLNKSIFLFKKINTKDYLREAYGLLADVYEEKKDLNNSIKFLKQSVVFKDSIYNKQQSDKINELQIVYQTEKKLNQINKLNQENKIQKLTVARRNTYLMFSLGALITFILLGFLFYNRYKLKQETRLQTEIIKQQDLATQAVLQAEEKERKRIAGDLHDGVGQLFSVVKMNLSGLLDRLKLTDTEDKLLAEKTIALVDESCKEVRSISHQMMPNVLLKSGLAMAIKDFIDKIDKETLQVNLQTVGLNQRLASNVEIVFYRVLQETVNNVIKHANATQLDIQLVKDAQSITATIEDNGKGFDKKLVETFEGIGLKNIRTRVEYLKGTVEFDSQIGGGTVVSVWIPLAG